jgi:hypothetical protein
MTRLNKDLASILGYLLLVPYVFIEPFLKIPDLMVRPGESNYDTHVVAALAAVVVHGLIVHLIFRGMKHETPFGISLLVAISANVILKTTAILYVVVSL